MELRHKHYRSFLMRVWRSGDNRAASWRVSLVDPISGEQIGFTDMEDLTNYVQELIARETALQETDHDGEAA